MPKHLWLSLVVSGVLAEASSVGFAHELWIEAPSRSQPGVAVPIEICFGHPGERSPREMLQANAGRVAAALHAQRGMTSRLKLGVDDDGYPAEVLLSSPGLYQVSAVLEVGIVKRAQHGIEAGTRLVMLAKASIKAGEATEAVEPLGHLIEIVPLSDVSNLKVGDGVQFKILKEGRPIGGPDVLVSLATSGGKISTDSPVTEDVWTIEGHPNADGEIAFRLIAPGRHIASLSYVDETPGNYEGRLEFDNDFSHLKPGDAYPRSRYVVTFTFNVE